jgi:basic membrane protein A
LRKESILNRKSQARRPGSQVRERTGIALAVGGGALTIIAAGCFLFAGGSGQTPTSSGGSTGSSMLSNETATPALRIVKSITLVAAIGEPKDWTPTALAWKAIQAEGKKVGAKTSLVEPVSNADFPKDVDAAAAADGAVVVTVGPAASVAVGVAARAHTAAQFLEIDVVVPTTEPANVHGLVFDEAEAGYLAGYVAASFANPGKIGMVGDTKTDTRTANYWAGFRSGALQATSGVTAEIGYAGTPDSPDKGRTAAAARVNAGDSVMMAMPSLSGIGAEREACTRKAQIVAVDSDAWQMLPEIRSCLIVSVLKRYDTAVGAA